MRPIEISDFNAADEFVVEAMMQDGKFKVIGKVIIDNNLLNDDDLETIWDYANWETNGYEKMVVSNGVYKGLKAFSDGRLFYVITDDELGVVTISWYVSIMMSTMAIILSHQGCTRNNPGTYGALVAVRP